MYGLNINKKEFSFLPILVVTILISAGCASFYDFYYGELRKGYITEVTDSTAVVGLGRKNGAWIGEELDVYEIIIAQRLKDEPPLYKNIYKGRIRITEIIDDYHSKAIIVSGQVRENYKVEGVT